MKQITGTGVAMIDKYTRFDPKTPEKTEAAAFHIFTEGVTLNKDGSLKASWAKDGYIMVGKAQITIDLLPAKDVTKHAVAALQEQRKVVQANAAAECTRIDAQIQSLLAITNEA